MNSTQRTRFGALSLTLATFVAVMISASPVVAQLGDALKKAAQDSGQAALDEATGNAQAEAEAAQADAQKKVEAATGEASKATDSARDVAAPAPIGGGATDVMEEAAKVGASEAAKKAAGGAGLGSAAQHGGKKAMESAIQGTTGSGATEPTPPAPEE